MKIKGSRYTVSMALLVVALSLTMCGGPANDEAAHISPSTTGDSLVDEPPPGEVGQEADDPDQESETNEGEAEELNSVQEDAKAPPPAIPPASIPEGTSEAPAVLAITDLILGVSARGYDHYAMGATAVMGGSDAYLFIDPKACGMKLKVRTMPASALPGATALEDLHAVYQQNYVEQSPGSESWTITQEPFELELNGEPAARLEAERVRNDRVSLFQITVIRSQTRAAIVQGQISESCAKNPASMAYLNEMTDSVMLHDPAPVCYVGFKPGSDPAEYGVGCDKEAAGWIGQESLADGGFTQIEMGPVTWDECAEFMRTHDQESW